MPDLDPEFDSFLKCWRGLPRRAHPFIPCRSDISPAKFGALLHSICLTEALGAKNLRICYAGSGFERNAGFSLTGKNYYDLLPASFHKPMSLFHNNLLDTPCGAYVADVIGTTAGTRYIHHTLQLPAADEAGNICYLIAFGLARRPYGDHGNRTETSHQPSNIKELFYIDLGAGMPSAYIKDFEFHAPAKSHDKRKTSSATQ